VLKFAGEVSFVDYDHTLPRKDMNLGSLHLYESTLRNPDLDGQIIFSLLEHLQP
jgi:hypothetical protein